MLSSILIEWKSLRACNLPLVGNRKEKKMKKLFLAILLAGSLPQMGCSPEFWGGTALGALGAGGGYEYNNKRQMDKLDDDRKDGKISREEYEDRKRQIRKARLSTKSSAAAAAAIRACYFLAPANL